MSPCCCRCCCSHSIPSSINDSEVVVESSLSCCPSNDGMSLFSFALHYSVSLFLATSPCCRCCCCSRLLPSSINASGVVVDSSLSGCPSNVGMSLFSFTLRFSLSLFLPTSPCCHHCCCSHSIPSSINESEVVVESLLSCCPSNDGTSLFSFALHFSLSLFLPMSPCCRRRCCSRLIPSY